MNPESILGTPVGDVNTPWMGYQSITGHLLAFFLGRWEETVEPKESPHKHVENTQNSTQTQNLGAASWKSYSLHHRASHLEKNHEATKNLKVYYGGKNKNICHYYVLINLVRASFVCWKCSESRLSLPDCLKCHGSICVFLSFKETNYKTLMCRSDLFVRI